jgi:hypothetical protein
MHRSGTASPRSGRIPLLHGPNVSQPSPSCRSLHRRSYKRESYPGRLALGNPLSNDIQQQSTLSNVIVLGRCCGPEKHSRMRELASFALPISFDNASTQVRLHAVSPLDILSGFCTNVVIGRLHCQAAGCNTWKCAREALDAQLEKLLILYDSTEALMSSSVVVKRVGFNLCRRLEMVQA